MKRKYTYTTLLFGVWLVVCFGLAQADGSKQPDPRASGTNQMQMDWLIISSGGEIGATGATFDVDYTLGQPVIDTSSSDNYRVSLGFWAGLPAFPNSVEELPSEQLPTGFSLQQNYPNPFNPSTIIEFTVPELANVRLTVYNLLGQEVMTLVDQEMSAGVYRAAWDGQDRSGTPVAGGVYFYRLETDEFAETRKMVLLK